MSSIGFYPQSLDLCYVQSYDDIKDHIPFQSDLHTIVSLYWKVKKWMFFAEGLYETDVSIETIDTVLISTPPLSEKNLICGENIVEWTGVNGEPFYGESPFWVTMNNSSLNEFPFVGGAISPIATYNFLPNAPSDIEIVGTSTLNLGDLGGSYSWDCYGIKLPQTNVQYGNITITALEFWNY